MSTLSVADIPLESDRPAQRLRRTAAAVRRSLYWWGTHRSLSARQKEEVSAGYAADARFLTAGKRILDVRHGPSAASPRSARASSATGAA